MCNPGLLHDGAVVQWASQTALGFMGLHELHECGAGPAPTKVSRRIAPAPCHPVFMIELFLLSVVECPPGCPQAGALQC
jgi:hypothetical protein